MRKVLIVLLCNIGMQSLTAQIPTASLQMCYKADVGFTPGLWNDQSGNGEPGEEFAYGVAMVSGES